MQLLNVLSQMAPVIIMLIIGFLLKKTGFVPQSSIKSIKNIVFYITLPAILFNAFYNVKYNYTVFIFFVIVFLCCGLALILAFLIKKIFRIKHNMYPFLLTGFEAGMLGYALYSIAYGSDKLTNFATCDLGQTVFVYTVVMTALYCQTSGGITGVKKAIKNMSVTPAFWSVLIGIIVGMTGLGYIINNSLAGPALAGTLKFIGSPTGPFILLIVGYELEFSVSNIKSAAITIFTRLLVLIPLLFLAWTLIHTITGTTDILLKAALAIMFVLPAPFVIPFFTDKDDEKEYISTTLSLNTMVSIILFMVAISIIK